MNELARVVRREREKRGWSQRELAERVNVKPQSIQQLEAGDVQHPRYIHHLSRVFGVDLLAYLQDGTVIAAEAKTSGASAAGTPTDAVPAEDAPTLIHGRDLPVYASAQGGPTGMLISYEPIEWKERPAPLHGVKGAFAMYVVNDSMEPRFRQGDLILVHPTRPVRRGDAVLLVQTTDEIEHSAMVKELVKRTAEQVVVRQHNPDREISIPADQVRGLHKIVGTYYE